ncbi:MAG: hypothetical protein HY445_00090 [Candidatus Niyogibacteria bacterium]|nr:hypothetical protein [Candidatus Niyogibacteria bacterium]
MKKRIIPFFIFLFIVLSYSIVSAQEKDFDSLCLLDTEFVQVTLPPDFIAKVKMTVQFAFDQRAAYAISLVDLNHFHLVVPLKGGPVSLILEKETKTGWDKESVLHHIQKTEALLFHSQEKFKFTGLAHKRNIFLDFKKGAPEILDPEKYGVGPPSYHIYFMNLKGYFYGSQDCLFDITGMENEFEKEMANTFKVKSLLAQERTILIRFPKKTGVAR